MPAFDKGGSALAPFGKNEYRRSTKGLVRESYTCADGGVPSETIDGDTQKVLQPGTVMALITSGGDAGKIGAYESNVRAESVSIAVDATGGTFTISFGGETTAAIAFNATAAAVQAALELLEDIDKGDITVTGGPGSAGGATPYVIAFNVTGQYGQTDAPAMTTGAGSLTGGAGTAAVTTTAGGATGTGATDGRGDPANIVGINDTFLPWQLLERDCEVAVTVGGTVKQDWCFEYDASGARVAMSDATRDAILALPALRNLVIV